MSKKKVTAPLTYNPGKGRPKEHLAYLNYQEMQALKRLNGNNQERGPGGLPSFPPAGAMSGGSAKSPASTSKAAGAGSRPSSGGPRSGMSGSVSPTSGSPRGSNPSSNFGGGGSNSGSRPSGGMMGGTGSGGSSRTAASRAPSVAGRGTDPNGIGRSDKAAINAVNNANTKTALKSPAINADRSRTMNVGPMGTPVNVKTGQAGSQIKGAIKSVQEETKRSVVPKATVTSPMATQGTSFASPLDARIENFQRINDARLKSGALGPEGVLPVSRIAAENARRLNTVKMTQQYSQYRSPPTGYPAAPQGVYGPRANADVGYLRMSEMPGMITTGMPSSYSGTINPRFNAESTLRAYEEAKRVPGKIQDRVPVEAPSLGRTRGLPSLGDERVLKVENIMSDAGIRKSIPGYAPSRPTVVSGEGYVNPAGVPDSVKRALDAAGYNPDGTKKTPQANGIVGLSNGVPEEGIPGYGIDPNNISRGFVPGASKVAQPTNITGPWPGQSAIPPNPPVYRPENVAKSKQVYDRVVTVVDPSGKKVSTTLSDLSNMLQRNGVDPAQVANQMEKFVDAPQQEIPVGRNVIQTQDGLLTEGEYRRMPNAPPPSVPQNNIRRTASGTYTKPYDQGESTTFVSPTGERFVATKEQIERLDPADQQRLAEYKNYPLTSMGTAPVVDMPQISLTPEQAKEVGNRVERGKTAIRVAGSRVPGLGGFLGGKYEESVKKKLDNYVLATPEQRAEMERKDPSLTAWAGIIGETPQLDRSNYTNWAEKSGLRGPPSREGGGDNSGIASLVDKPKGDETTTPTPDTPSTTPGRRPDIYYMWDLGVNIPSPGDPNYTQYQTYLAERLSARQAVG